MLIGRACGRYVFELREMDVCVLLRASAIVCNRAPRYNLWCWGAGGIRSSLSITVGDVLAVYRSVTCVCGCGGVVSCQSGLRDARARVDGSTTHGAAPRITTS